MTRTIAMAIAGLIVTGSAATAATDTKLSEVEQAKLNALPYEMRQEIEPRMGPEQTVSGLVETTLLNELEGEDITKIKGVEVLYRARVLDSEGNWRLVDIDPLTYEVTDTALAVEEHVNYDPDASQPMTGDTQVRSSESYSPTSDQPGESGTGR